MTAFIDEHRDVYGVEPICEVLPIAPSTYYTHAARKADPELRAHRAMRDDALCEEIGRVWQEDRRVYGVRKVWRQLRREGFRVARRGALDAPTGPARRDARQDDQDDV